MLEISMRVLPHAEQHAYAHKLLGRCLERYGIDYKNSAVGKGEYGKPYLLNCSTVHYNLSDCSGMTVCYVGRYEAGVDAENVRPCPKKVMRRVFTQGETRLVENAENPDLMFFRLWTLKESFVKAIGIGISYPMKTIEFSFGESGITSNADGFVFSQHIISDRYVVSLCRISDPKKKSQALARMQMQET